MGTLRIFPTFPGVNASVERVIRVFNAFTAVDGLIEMCNLEKTRLKSIHRDFEDYFLRPRDHLSGLFEFLTHSLLLTD